MRISFTRSRYEVNFGLIGDQAIFYYQIRDQLSLDLGFFILAYFPPLPKSAYAKCNVKCNDLQGLVFSSNLIPIVKSRPQTLPAFLLRSELCRRAATVYEIDGMIMKGFDVLELVISSP